MLLAIAAVFLSQRASAPLATPIPGQIGSDFDTGVAASATPEPTPVVVAALAATAPPSAPPAPTAAPSPEPTATQLLLIGATPSASDLLARVAEAEAALRSGEFEATIEHRDGTRSVAQVRFDLGDEQHPPRLHVVSTYTSAAGSQIAERISVGERSWERQPDGSWITLPEQEGAWGHMQQFLPHADKLDGAQIDEYNDSIATLSWDDAASDAELTLTVDLADGTPHELRRVSRAEGVTLTVIYSGWNVPVEIAPPSN